MANAVNQFCALCEATGTYLQLSNVSPPMMQQQVENLLRNMERFRHRPEAHDPRVLVAIQRLTLPVEEKNQSYGPADVRSFWGSRYGTDWQW